ncbi:1,4-dihydroxy-2-naphthoate polyprenyltransferase [Bacteroides reticulotermitis]|uniref:1,4-dihydroxy-2-naphthoate octaprenyltransferase n=2 Tax=Bacteroides reticulotermitis TaxID=1133319 RepID=W4UX76_9BACE|nr:1,4-dihydroxy-2-naphthoate polyprenyltransferase [Bacteroides reticulotermitis]MBB4042277.1 1,4-dihydroxy-2-naphthoate octaprenyltransferase [Bacteroides reticulotermitis]GAE85213.1 1,4-dihydroxy-2-naphthoate octaprenyltransferase [Bacteroides reticulotermitis JCM 10512]
MEEVKRNSLRAWLLAARPKTLTGAITPVLIGTALATMDGHFQWLPALVCALFAGLMQIAANFINDLFDYLKGTDREDRLGPERACAQGWISPQAMRKGIFATIALACLIGSTLLFYAGWQLILVGLVCVLFAFLYTTGPYPLSYNGWGDALVIVFFGFVPVGGTYYVQALTWTADVTIASLICGILIDTLLVVNNYRDREADARSGKRTLVVRFGEKFGQRFYLLLGLFAAWLCLWFAIEGHLFAALLPQLYVIMHVRTWQRMVKIHSGKKLNSILGETSRNMLLFGVLLSIGMILSAC